MTDTDSGGFFLPTRILGGCSTTYSLPALFFFLSFFFLKWRFAYAHKFHSFCQDQCTGAQQAEMTETDTTSLRIHSGHTAGLRQPMLFTEAQHCKSRDYVFHSELLGSYVVVSHHETDPLTVSHLSLHSSHFVSV